MGKVYKDFLIDRKNQLELELERINQEIDSYSSNIIDEELKNVNPGKIKIMFVESPSFLYDIKKDALVNPIMYNNTMILGDGVRRIVVGNYKVTDDNTLSDLFNSFDDEIKRVAFYLSPSGSIYHDGRLVRLAAF